MNYDDYDAHGDDEQVKPVMSQRNQDEQDAMYVAYEENVEHVHVDDDADGSIAVAAAAAVAAGDDARSAVAVAAVAVA